MAVESERVGKIQNGLGEGPVWDATEKALYWIDGAIAEIYRLDPASNDFKSWKVPAAIGSFALREKGGAVLALETGFHLFDFTTGNATAVIDPEPGNSHTRFNDGKTDARGRFIAGTMDARLKEPRGSLFQWSLLESRQSHLLFLRQCDPHHLCVRLRPRNRWRNEPPRVRQN